MSDFTVTIGKIKCEPEMRDEIERIALAAGLSRANVMRMALEIGLPQVAESLAGVSRPARTSPAR